MKKLMMLSALLLLTVVCVRAETNPCVNEKGETLMGCCAKADCPDGKGRLVRGACVCAPTSESAGGMFSMTASRFPS